MVLIEIGDTLKTKLMVDGKLEKTKNERIFLKTKIEKMFAKCPMYDTMEDFLSVGIEGWEKSTVGRMKDELEFPHPDLPIDYIKGNYNEESQRLLAVNFRNALWGVIGRRIRMYGNPNMPLKIETDLFDATVIQFGGKGEFYSHVVS